MKHFLQVDFTYRYKLKTGIWGLLTCFLILFTACSEKEEPMPEGFNEVAGFQLIPFDSIFLVWPGDQELNLSPKFTGAYGDEVILPSIPSIQFFIDGKRSSNPPRIPTDKEREFEVYAKIGQLTCKPVKIRVVDVNPKTYVSGFKLSMGDSTKAPYAISGRSLVDIKVSVFDYREKEFAEEDKPDYKIWFDGILLENNYRVPVLRSGEIPFWAEVGGKKTDVEILYSRELPDISKKYSLPIIFHLIHSGEEIGTFENPSQAEFSRLLKETNDWMIGNSVSEFRKGHNQVDPNMEFYMAGVGPDGNPLDEPGINRIFSEKPSYAYGDESTYKYLFDQMWNPDEYVNIFVMNIDGRGGFAFYPPVSDSVLSRFYGFAMNKGISTFTMIHETGHFLGLRHTFSNGYQCTDADGFPDTESYNDELKKSQNYLKTNCDEEFFFATNVMDYHPSVYNSFTLDQVIKMRGIIERGHFLPKNSDPNGRIHPQPWTRGVFDPTVKPID